MSLTSEQWTVLTSLFGSLVVAALVAYGLRFMAVTRKRPKVRDSTLFGMYAFELYSLAKSIAANCERLFAFAPPKIDGTYLKPLNEAHGMIASILSDCAKVKRLCEASPKSRKESTEQHQFRKDRVAELRKLLTGVLLSELLNSKIRNTLEHFDEYLDEANVRFTTQGPGDSTHAFTNLIMSDWNHLSERRIFPIRVYIANEKAFYNMAWRIDMGKIAAEAKAIVAALDKHPDTDQLHEAGAMGVALVGSAKPAART